MSDHIVTFVLPIAPERPGAHHLAGARMRANRGLRHRNLTAVWRATNTGPRAGRDAAGRAQPGLPTRPLLPYAEGLVEKFCNWYVGRLMPLPGMSAAMNAPDRPPPRPSTAPCRQHEYWRRLPPPWNCETEEALLCTHVRAETHDVKSFFSARRRPRLRLHARSFLTLELDIGGTRLNRCYTISSPPTQPHTLSITVKRVPGGPVSNWLHDHLSAGMSVRTLGPAGVFSNALHPAERYLFLSAGSGITPLMSMARTTAICATTATSSSSTTPARPTTSSSSANWTCWPRTCRASAPTSFVSSSAAGRPGTD